MGISGVTRLGCRWGAGQAVKKLSNRPRHRQAVEGRNGNLPLDPRAKVGTRDEHPAADAEASERVPRVGEGTLQRADADASLGRGLGQAQKVEALAHG